MTINVENLNTFMIDVLKEIRKYEVQEMLLLLWQV